MITGEITSNQYISFLFNSFAAFYLIGLILIRFTFLFLDHILRERLRLSLDKELKFSSINKLLKKRNKEVSMLITVGMYVLNILDANVDAHLLQYNVDDNLSFQPFIDFSNPDYNYNLGVELHLNF